MEGRVQKVKSCATCESRPPPTPSLAGDLESAPVLRSVQDDGCFYEFEWHSAAACVLSRTEGSNCTVLDAEAGGYRVLGPFELPL